MNKLLVAIFANETAANNGLNALHKLHAAGDITLYDTGVLARDANGALSVKKAMGPGATGTITGLAIGSLIGLLGGPAGMLIGAAAGTVAGAVRDFWTAGVGLDFIEEATAHLKAGKVALLADIEEEWVLPVDAALEAAGGQVYRRSRNEVEEAQFDHDIASFRSEIKELESEAAHAGSASKAALEAKIALAKTGLDGAVKRAQKRVDMLKQEADAKAKSLSLQLSQAQGDVKSRIEDRIKHVKSAYHARGAKLAQAWSLTKAALST